VHRVIPVDLVKMSVRTGSHEPDCRGIIPSVTDRALNSAVKDRQILGMATSSSVADSPYREHVSVVYPSGIGLSERCIGGQGENSGISLCKISDGNPEPAVGYFEFLKFIFTEKTSKPVIDRKV